MPPPPRRAFDLPPTGEVQLALFAGPHLPETRCRAALDRLDLRAAIADAPDAWRGPIEAMAGAILLRGGETTAARASADRHLASRPADAAAWLVLAEIVVLPAAVRCAFHGGPVLPPIDDLLHFIEEDDVAPTPRWVLSYAFIADLVPRSVLEEALRAEDRFDNPPLPLPGDGTAFAWYLVAEEERRSTPMPGDVSPVAARRAMQRISAPTFRRYLGRAARAGRA